MDNRKTKDQELILTRTINAPCEDVWKAWTEPERLKRWWGPKGFTNPLCKIDVRPRGVIRIDMRAPDGTVYPMSGAFVEIVRPKRLVFTSAALDEKGKPLFEVHTAVTFEAVDGRTKLALQARVLTAGPGAAPYLDGMPDGWAQSLERLAEACKK